MIKGNMGMDISIGDFVVYPGRQKSSIWMRYGFVVDIVNDKLKIARGIRYMSFDVQSYTYKQTNWYKRINTVANTSLVSKVDFSLTEFNDPSHEQYEIFQEIRTHLEQ